MKEVILVLILNVAFSSAIYRRPRLRRNLGANSVDQITINSYNFSQKMDHFNLENDQEWNQRYWASKTYYQEGGPAFLLINGEWSVDGPLEFTESWTSYAKKLNAICFSLEHRFYGRSWPGKENMRLLSSGQALGDIANFIKGATEIFELPKDTKWILFGCSYAGMLAAWARLKYPHMIHGAVASSAPLLSQTDYIDYPLIVENALRMYDPKCVESITQATEEMALYLNETENSADISNMFGLCNEQQGDPLKEVKTLFADMIIILFEAVQMNDTTRINIPFVCDTMTDHDGTKLEAFAELRKMYTKYNEDKYTDNIATQSWNYQVCSELGGFFTYNRTYSLSALSHLFPLENEIKDGCQEFYGPNFGIKEMDEKMMRTNLLYGGLDFNAANTIFIQGSIDPWHTSGPYKKTNDALHEIILIDGTSHCADCYPISEEDTPELKKAREEILKTLKKWLKK